MKHGCSWEDAAPKSDAGCGIQSGCLCIDAASELFFFFSDSHQLSLIRADSVSIRANLARIGPYQLATEMAEMD